MFTDIEGSTALWESSEVSMRSALARHDLILRESVSRHGGTIFATGGDGIAAAFSSAPDAVEAAIATQEAMYDEDWPQETVLRVRIGLHTGEAEERNDDYFGPPVNRAARIMSAANGGHILMSAVTAGIVGRTRALDLVSLGNHRLRGVADPIELFAVRLQADGDAGIGRGTPMRGLHPTMHHVPRAIGQLVGRDGDLLRLKETLRVDRILTLVGPGGCGKTRLAQHAAMSLIDDHFESAWWVDLSPLTSSRQVAERVAATLGLMAQPDADLTSDICAALAALPRVLLIVDNAEHVIDEAAPLVQEILERCTEVTVLVTSREPLGVPHEVVWRVPSLTVPAVGADPAVDELDGFGATQLFVERVRQARPGMAIDQAGASTIAAICRRLDGIPLAIELAAARTRSMSLDTLAAALDDAFRVLTGGARTALERQQTLRASIAWSVDLLDPVELALLRRLAVIESRFDVEAAEAVAADGDLVDARCVLDVVGRLVDKSLIVFDDAAGTHRMLDTIRQYAMERLIAAGEVDTSRARHCEWVARWTENIDSGRVGFAFDPSHEMIPDVISALDWAYEASPASVYRICRGLAWVRDEVGHYREFDRMYAWVEERADDSDDRAQWAAAAAGLSPAAWTTGRFEYMDLAMKALTLLPDSDRGSRRLIGYFVDGLNAVLGGDPTSVQLHFDTARADGDLVAAITFGDLVALVHTMRGEMKDAARAIESVRTTLERNGLPFNESTAGFGFASDIGRLTQCGLLGEAVGLGRSSGRTNNSASAVLAIYIAELGWLTADHSLLGRSVAMIEGEMPPLMLGPVLLVRALDALRRGDVHESIALAASSFDEYPTARALAASPLRLLALSSLIAHDLTRLDERLDVFTADVERTGRPPLPTAHLLQIGALLARDRGDRDKMVELSELMLATARQHSLALLEVDALELLGEAAFEVGDRDRARGMLQTAATRRNTMGYATHVVPNPAAIEALLLGTRHPW